MVLVLGRRDDPLEPQLGQSVARQRRRRLGGVPAPAVGGRRLPEHAHLGPEAVCITRRAGKGRQQAERGEAGHEADQPNQLAGAPKLYRPFAVWRLEQIGVAGIALLRPPEPVVAAPEGEGGEPLAVVLPQLAHDQPRGVELRDPHRETLSARCGALALQIDDHVGDRQIEALLRPLHLAALQPVRASRRVRRDDDLVGRKLRQGIRDGLNRVGVADGAACLEPAAAKRLHRCGQPLFRRSAGGVDVGEEMVQAGVEGGRDDEDLSGLTALELVEQLPPRQGLVRDHEHLATFHGWDSTPGGPARGRRRYPLRAAIASVSFGTTVSASPTTPRSANSKMGALASLLMATITPEFIIPTLCWIAPETPAAT